MKIKKSENLEELFEEIRAQERQQTFVDMLKELYSDDCLSSLVFKQNPFLKMAESGSFQGKSVSITVKVL